MPVTDAARIHDQLGHPVLDGDGHWVESLPVIVEYVRDVAGADLAEQYRRSQERQSAWYAASWEERRERRLGRGNWWITTADTLDFASAMLPSLLVERMGELGIDYGVVYPTRCLGGNNIAQDDLRQAVCRAYNTMVADVFRDHARHLTPAALIPCYSPDEAIAELDYAITRLGLKAASFKGSLPRPIAAYAQAEQVQQPQRGAGVPQYIDALGLDNPYDYDPLWQKCLDLGVAATVHQGSNGWPNRTSVSNGEFNRVGHAADAHAPLTKALFLGGVVRRFPDLTFSFLEGGVGYGVELLCGLVGGFEKRHYAAMVEHLRPTNIDTGRLRELIDRYGYGRLKATGDQAIASLRLKELVDRETESLDDYAALGVASKEELVEQYSRNFYFGCEADDPCNVWAFDERMPGRLKAMLGTDVGHWDVTDFADVLPEVWEMVEDALISERDLRDLTFSNAVELHTRMNRDFFKDTAVEEAVERELATTTQEASHG
ncbi:MAG TPA: amidohydrolase family protein [Chloroflexota bacterium]